MRRVLHSFRREQNYMILPNLFAFIHTTTRHELHTNLWILIYVVVLSASSVILSNSVSHEQDREKIYSIVGEGGGWMGGWRMTNNVISFLPFRVYVALDL